jgi:hypothetical protein
MIDKSSWLSGFGPLEQLEQAISSLREYARQANNESDKECMTGTIEQMKRY